MSDYTPTTDEVRTRYAVSLFHTEHGPDEHVHDSVSDGDAEFDRWLADRDREVAAQALEDLAKHDGDWTARAWRPQEAETVVKMRKAILRRAAALGLAVKETPDEHARG